MDDNMKNINYKRDDSESDISLWDVVTILLRNWKIVIVITLIFGILGSLLAFAMQEPVKYVYSRKVIFTEFEYYPIDFEGSYTKLLGQHLNEEFYNLKDLELDFETKVKDDYFNYLTIKFSNMSYETAFAVVQDIVKWHNNVMYEEVNRLIEVKQNETNVSYDEYLSAQDSYHNFLYGSNGYYLLEDDLGRYKDYINSYKMQIEKRRAILEKVENGFPLLLEDIYLDEGMPIDYYQRNEIIKNHYSAENLQKEIEFLNGKLTENQKLYDETSSLYNEMTIKDAALKFDRNTSLRSWEKRANELSVLEYNATKISDYYVPENEIFFSSERGHSWYIYAAVAFMAGFALAVFYIFAKKSYLEYKGKNN